jgi:flagellar hook-associated protein 1 FlgK
MEQSAPIRDRGGTMSTGVTANQKIQRFYDQFVVAQLNAESEDLGRWEAQKTALEKIEVLFDEVSGYGLSDAMTEYWTAWQDLSNNPSGYVERTNLLSAAQYLTSTFNQLSTNISNAQSDIDTNIVSVVEEVNTLADQIAELNVKITEVEVSGHAANDYRDQRDTLVKQLSQLIDIDTFEDGDGNTTVMVAGGRSLVEAGFTWGLTTADSGGVQNVYWIDSSGGTQDITTDIDSGELKGWIESRDVLIDDYATRLDDLAAGIIQEVNNLHGAGYGLDGSQNDFFTGTDAGDIAVNSAIIADADLIAAAGDAAALPGDNSVAISIAELQNTLTMSGGSATFYDYYTSLVSDVGSDVSTANLNYDHQTIMIQHLETYREEISGVSLDEEMVNLVKFQHAYNAAAKLITTTDEMMDTIIAIAN